MHSTKIHQDCKTNKEKDTRDYYYDKISKGKSSLLCFRPSVVVDGFGCENGGKRNSVIQYIEMEPNKDGVVFPQMYPALLQPSSSQTPPPEKDVVNHRKKKNRKKFLQLLKAVFFETSLARKLRKKASMKKLKQSKKSNPSGKVEKDLNLNPLKGKSFYKRFSRKDGIIISNSPSENASFPCSSSSVLPRNSTNSKQLVIDKVVINDPIESKKMMLDIVKENGKGYYGTNTGLFLLLVTLLVLVFWGKLYAILCTSTWLFFVPNWNSGKKLLNNRDKSESMDLEENKKSYGRDIRKEWNSG
ncbi:hypothetical protein JCGZ_00721 [Jatropha curcas]|uniref:Uncharacterized protein n=1 Tax=Jatropha curcas TaxID=180498 RepID=A0A067L4D9_JATCU|nr:uncharacterized protein LOC105633210 [Jatropha curcas]KDP38964.1 hypothetical protein JCGZ_00721 [Jatropha curcas]